MQLRFADVQPVFLRQKLGDAQRTAAGDDRHFVNAIGTRHDPGQQGVARFVNRGHPFFLAGQHVVALGAHQHAVAGVLEVVHVDLVLAVARRPQGGFVDQVADVGAGQSDGAAGQPIQIDVVCQWNIAHVDFENRQAALVIRPVDRDVAIETTGPQQGRVEHVGTIGGGQHDHRFGLAEAVHLAQDLVERLFPLVMSASQAGPPHAADGVDLVDEQNRGRGFLGCFEHVAHAAGTDADEHLNELGTADRKERHAGFARHGPGQEGLAGARGTHQQNALGHAPAEPLEFFGVL